MMPPDKLNFRELFDFALRPNAEVFVVGNKESELIGKIDIVFVVRCGGKKNASAVIFVDVFMDRAIAFPLAIAEIVTLVDQHDFIAL